MPTNALYSVQASCTAPAVGACTPVLLYSAPANSAFRGLFVAPIAPLTAPSASTSSVPMAPSATASNSPPASVSAPASASPSNSPTPSGTPSNSPTPSSTASTGSVPTPAAAAPAFNMNSLLVLRVGDGTAPLTAASAAVFIDEYDSSLAAAAAPTSTRPVSTSDSVSLSGTDWGQGTLTRSVDGANVFFSAVRAPVGTAAQATTPWIPGDRVVVRLSVGGATFSTTTVPATAYDGLIRSVCAKDANGFFVVGNSTTVGVGYLPSGTTGAMNTILAGTQGDFSACALGSSGKIYLMHSSMTAYFFFSFANFPTSGTVAVPAPALFNSGMDSKQIMVNAAETKIWVADVAATIVTEMGLYTGPLPALNSLSGIVAATFRITGIALSADESKLWMTTRAPTHGVYWILTSCAAACVPTLLFPAGANTEFRGIALAPNLPFPTPSPSPAAGSQCPVNFGLVKAAGALGLGSCVACGPGSSKPAATGTACTCAASGAVWSSTTNTCGCVSPLSSLGLTSGATLACLPCSASCPAGLYITGPCTAATDVGCSLCTVCGEGTFVQTPCSGSSNAVCAQCPAGQFSYGAQGENAASCTPCGAGSVPSLGQGGCVCSAANAVWTRASNSCGCAPGYTASGSGATLSCAVCTSCASQTPTASTSPSITGTTSVTPTASLTTGATPSPTPSNSPPNSASSTPTPTASNTPPVSPGATQSVTPSRTPTNGPPSPSGTPTPSASPSLGAVLAAGAGGGGSAGGGSDNTATIGGIVIGGIALVGVIAYYLQNRGGKKQGGGGGGGQLARQSSQWGGPAPHGDDAPVVLPANPLRQGGAPAAFAQQPYVQQQQQQRAAFVPVSSRAVPASLQYTQCTQLATGKTWFYCDATGITVWALPEGGVVTREMAS